MRANARAPFPEPFGPTSRPRGLLERDTGDGSEPGRTSRTLRQLGPTRLPRGSRSNRRRFSLRRRMLAGLRAHEHFGFRRFPSPTASQLRREPVLVVDVVLAYRCGAAPEFPPGSLLSPEPKLRAPARPKDYRAVDSCQASPNSAAELDCRTRRATCSDEIRSCRELLGDPIRRSPSSPAAIARSGVPPSSLRGGRASWSPGSAGSPASAPGARPARSATVRHRASRRSPRELRPRRPRPQTVARTM